MCFSGRGRCHATAIVILLALVAYRSAANCLSVVIVLLYFFFVHNERQNVHALGRGLTILIITVATILVASCLLHKRRDLLCIRILGGLFNNSVNDNIGLTSDAKRCHLVAIVTDLGTLSVSPFNVNFSTFCTVQSSFSPTTITTDVTACTTICKIVF